MILSSIWQEHGLNWRISPPAVTTSETFTHSNITTIEENTPDAKKVFNVTITKSQTRFGENQNGDILSTRKI